MFRLIWAASIRTHRLLRWAPTNLLLDRIRTRRGLKWGAPAMLLALPYLLAATTCEQILRGGGPGWLNLLVVLFAWNALKMLWIGPISLILLAKARWAERRARVTSRRAARPNDQGSSQPEQDRASSSAERSLAA